jgi:hypothetical protein
VPTATNIADRLAAGARAQVGLPGAEVSSPRRAWEDRVEGVWSVVAEDARDRRGAWLRFAGDRVSVPAGMDQAARELWEMQPLAHDDWGGGLIYVVLAAGAATPAYPDVWDTTERARPDGGVQVVARMTERDVAFAVAGGAGQPEPASTAGGGRAAPPTMTTATLEIGSDYALAWSYSLGGRTIAGPAGVPASRPPRLDDGLLVAALEGARQRSRAPRAMPLAEPHAVDGAGGVIAVELSALGTVYVDVAGAARSRAVEVTTARAGSEASVAEMLLWLSAAGALPAGLLPFDFAHAQVSGTELAASAPAPLIEWSAGLPGLECPRVPGAYTAEAMTRRGRARLPLDGSLRWTLEVQTGDGWAAVDAGAG